MSYIGSTVNCFLGDSRKIYLCLHTHYSHVLKALAVAGSWRMDQSCRPSFQWGFDDFRGEWVKGAEPQGDGSVQPGDSRSVVLGDSHVRGGGYFLWILQRGSPWRTWNLVAPCEYSSLGGSQTPGLITPLYSCLSSTAPSSLHPFLCLSSFLSQLGWIFVTLLLFFLNPPQPFPSHTLETANFCHYFNAVG